MKERVTYLDHIKLLLTILVIAHHAAQAYTMGGDWSVKDTTIAAGLNNFLTVNMTFFMSAFFFISGYFVPGSKGRKSNKEYIVKKAKRLLCPVLGLLFFVVPVYSYFVYRMTIMEPLSFVPYYFKIYWGEGQFSYDHGWFLVSLFLYSLFYLCVAKKGKQVKGALTSGKIIGFTVGMAILTGMIRLVYPIDTWVNVLGIIGIEPAHLPQYLLWFLAGVWAYENGWLEQITEKMGKYCVGIGSVTVLIIYTRNCLPAAMTKIIYAFFPLYESIMSVTIIISLLYLFRKYGNEEKLFLSLATKSAFGMYLVHNLYVILFQIVMTRQVWNGYVKWLAVVALASVCSFVTAVLIRKGAEKLRNEDKNSKNQNDSTRE